MAVIGQQQSISSKFEKMFDEQNKILKNKEAELKNKDAEIAGLKKAYQETLEDESRKRLVEMNKLKNDHLCILEMERNKLEIKVSGIQQQKEM